MLTPHYPLRLPSLPLNSRSVFSSVPRFPVHIFLCLTLAIDCILIYIQIQLLHLLFEMLSLKEQELAAEQEAKRKTDETFGCRLATDTATNRAYLSEILPSSTAEKLRSSVSQKKKQKKSVHVRVLFCNKGPHRERNRRGTICCRQIALFADECFGIQGRT
jgi:hypothetical protein